MKRRLLTAALAWIAWYVCTIESFGCAWLWPLVDREESPVFLTFLKRNARAYKQRDEAVVGWNRRQQK